MNDKIEALENYNRARGQTISEVQANLNRLNNKVELIGTDLNNYKEYVESRFGHNESVLESRITEHAQKIDIAGQNIQSS